MKKKLFATGGVMALLAAVSRRFRRLPAPLSAEERLDRAWEDYRER